MKVLITSVSAGSGHVRAAEALHAAFQKRDTGHLAVHANIMDLVTPNFLRIYEKGYQAAVTHAPALWGRLYNFWDHHSTDGTLTSLLHRVQRSRAVGFFDFLERFQPDVILTTHFLIPQLLVTNKWFRSTRLPIETVITDYDVHRFWVSDAVSRYYVGHDDMSIALRRYGVSPSKITVSGIPTHPCFTERVSLPPLFRRLQLDPQQPVILVLTGGMGLRPLANAVKTLLTLPFKAQIVTIAGRNAALRQELDTLQPPASVKLVNLGFVDNMHELLSLSDVVITKPGGLTVAECLAKKKLMILMAPIPGQEVRNSQFLLSHGAALAVDDLGELPSLVTQLFDDRALRHRLLAGVASCSRQDAAFQIIDQLTASFSLAA